MTDRAQFEAMLEALINDDQAAAKEIFHNIVVGKSREIYEELLESDFQVEGENPFADDQGTPSAHKSKEEEGEEEEEEGEEEEGEEEGEEEEEDGEDGEDDGFGGEDDGEEGEGDIEDRVMDLEDALEDLKAEFEQLLAGEEHEEEENPGVHGDGMPMHDIEAGMDEDPMNVMEYTIKVPSPKHGDDGVQKKSTIDNMKNDMGGTTANIAQNFSTTTGGTQGGLAKPTTEDLTKGLGDIQNRAGISKSKSFTKTVPEGHGAEKSGKKEQAVNDKSVIAKKVR